MSKESGLAPEAQHEYALISQDPQAYIQGLVDGLATGDFSISTAFMCDGKKEPGYDRTLDIERPSQSAHLVACAAIAIGMLDPDTGKPLPLEFSTPIGLYQDARPRVPTIINHERAQQLRTSKWTA